jgi:hypothetical protein
MELSIGAVHDRVGDRGPAAKYEAGPLDDILYPDGRPQNVRDDAQEWDSDASDQEQSGENENDADAVPQTNHQPAGEPYDSFPSMESMKAARTSPGIPAKGIGRVSGNGSSVHASRDAQDADTAASPAKKRSTTWFTGQAMPGAKLCRTEAAYGNSNREKLEIYSNK